jgi:hypothetical protein
MHPCVDADIKLSSWQYDPTQPSFHTSHPGEPFLKKRKCIPAPPAEGSPANMFLEAIEVSAHTSTNEPATAKFRAKKDAFQSTV